MHTAPVTAIKGVGPAKADVLKSEAGIETVEDLLYYIPRRYIDWSTLKKIADCISDEDVTVSGTVTSVQLIPARRKILNVEIDDGTDTLRGVFFGGFGFLRKKFTPGETVLFSGKIKEFRGKQIVHPEFDFIDPLDPGKSINTAGIIPLYKSSEGLKKSGFDSRGFRRIIRAALDNYLGSVREPLNSEVLSSSKLIGLEEAISAIHYPESFNEAESARRRLAFNEIYFLHFYMELSKKHIRASCTANHKTYDLKQIDEFKAGLNFKLTDDQVKSIKEISADLMSPFPMNRLLQGDVGSGKTVVALATSLLPVSAGEQVAIMAPTEILAKQHFMTAEQVLGDSVRLRLLTGSLRPKEKEAVYAEISAGEADIVIGTHALFQNAVEFKNLSYIIIDEQHRFGVEQRARLRNKGRDTDLLIMTATPIPRSLSMTVYGDLDVSNIRTKPSNRLSVKTMAFPESKIGGVYRSIEKYVKQGRQIYYILPLIEESEKVDLKSAVETHIKLKEIFPNFKISLIHGKLKQAEKDETMRLFAEGKIDILVSTTVIEVGIDVANASIIVVEHAERFGLSQLHQLRGRVGRGEHQSFCALVYQGKISGDSGERIRILTETDDGFKISEKDLQLRGSGQLIGTRQHGDSDFEFTDLAKDFDIIEAARSEAQKAVSAFTEINPDYLTSENAGPERLLNGVRKKRVLSILS